MALDANKLLQDAVQVTGDNSQSGCYFTLFADNYPESIINNKYVFGAIAMNQMLVEYDYSEAYNAGTSFATKLNKINVGMIDPNA